MNEILTQLQKYLHGNLKIDENRNTHEFVERFEEDYKVGAEKIVLEPQKAKPSRLFQNKWPTKMDGDQMNDSTNQYAPSFGSNRDVVTSSPRHTTLYQGVRTDIIRKNVKLSCQDEQQLLDFYIKLRTSMIQAGIFLREINDITEDEDLYEERDGLTEADYRVQSNALYRFLCNEDIIPQEFTFAQNCIKSFLSTMDGFQTLKRMLVLVHPLLNNRRPPNEPPCYSNSGDLHLYGQALQNFYLLHEIYGRLKYTDLDKSKQFLDGLDGDEYNVEHTQLTVILDTVKLNNVDLQVKHQFTSLASTIMNMKNKNSSTNVQINAFSGQRTFQKGFNKYQMTGTHRTNHVQNKNMHESSCSNDFPFKHTYDQDKVKKISNRFPATKKFQRDNVRRARYMDMISKIVGL